MENRNCFIDPIGIDATGTPIGRHRGENRETLLSASMEQKRCEWASKDANELMQALCVSTQEDARWAIRKIASALFVKDNESHWVRFRKRNSLLENARDGNAVDTLCWRCDLSDKRTTNCNWASRGIVRKDWHCVTLRDGAVRVCQCPAFILNAVGWKDQEVIAWLIAAVIGQDPEVAHYIISLSAGEMKPWVAFYNEIMQTLGSSQNETIGLRHK